MNVFDKLDRMLTGLDPEKSERALARLRELIEAMSSDQREGLRDAHATIARDLAHKYERAKISGFDRRRFLWRSGVAT